MGALQRVVIKLYSQKGPIYIARYDKEGQKAQCLWEHLTKVSRLASDFASKVALTNTGALIGIMHDLGKATREFQEYLKYKVGIIDKVSFDLKGSTLDHSTAGAQFLSEKFLKNDGKSTLTSDILAMVSASHHGFIDALAPDGNYVFGRRLEKSEQEARKLQAFEALPSSVKDRVNQFLLSGIDEEIINFLTPAIEPDFKTTERNFVVSLLVRYLLSCLIDADRIDAADFDSKDNTAGRKQGKYIEWSLLADRLESYLKNIKIQHEIDYMRRDISDNCLNMASRNPGLFRLSVPTGERVIIVTGCINVLVSRVSGTLTKYNSCIA